MITVQDIGSMLQMLEANYGAKFYDGVPKENVVMTWASQFRDDDPRLVMQGVRNCINTMPYKPTIADIRQRMSANRMKGQMTSMEAFNVITKAVDKSYDRESATKAYNDLPPILRKLVGFPSKLISWHHVSEESFQTVIMSAIRESYRELAKREADYYALPEDMKKSENWRVNAPEYAELPEPMTEKSIEEIVAEANSKSAENRVVTDELKAKTAQKVNSFIKPITENEMKMHKAKEKAEEKRRLDKMARSMK